MESTPRETHAALCKKLNATMHFHSDENCVTGRAEIELDNMAWVRLTGVRANTCPFRKVGKPWSKANRNNDLCVYSICKAKQMRK